MCCWPTLTLCLCPSVVALSLAQAGIFQVDLEAEKMVEVAPVFQYQLQRFQVHMGYIRPALMRWPPVRAIYPCFAAHQRRSDNWWSVIFARISNDKKAGDAFDAFQTFCGFPRRTVLMTGIKDLDEEDILKESLEVFFQKPSNSGGEIAHIRYVSKKKSLHAFFSCDDVTVVDNTSGI